MEIAKKFVILIKHEFKNIPVKIEKDETLAYLKVQGKIFEKLKLLINIMK